MLDCVSIWIDEYILKIKNWVIFGYEFLYFKVKVWLYDRRLDIVGDMIRFNFF